MKYTTITKDGETVEQSEQTEPEEGVFDYDNGILYERNRIIGLIESAKVPSILINADLVVNNTIDYILTLIKNGKQQ